MSFASEYEAINALEKNLDPSYLHLDKNISTREFSIGFGIAETIIPAILRWFFLCVFSPEQDRSVLSVC